MLVWSLQGGYDPVRSEKLRRQVEHWLGPHTIAVKCDGQRCFWGNDVRDEGEEAALQPGKVSCGFFECRHLTILHWTGAPGAMLGREGDRPNGERLVS